ncbi:cupin domain-containing protein [Halolamina sp. CBA1230]|uniref:cupin domain-containing protein n=1 Tax=Halolamina sp. CBA1230 TaxID=1853690 RepID=UPI0009A1EDDD|nr:cupin domain-containing protein [Halolamina sp. CBA1230]QKY19219.1 cupin domain-containing protein [Halolamina sp. CBA1230]
MERVTVDEVESVSPPDEGIPDGAMADSIGEVRMLAGPLGTAEVAVNHYELAPGESFTLSSHCHDEQEEVFYVESGEITFETPDDELTVDAGELLRVAPGEYQLGTNRGDESAAAIVVGAPREEESGKMLLTCGDCGEYTPHRLDESDEQYCCTECGAGFT